MSVQGTTSIDFGSSINNDLIQSIFIQHSSNMSYKYITTHISTSYPLLTEVLSVVSVDL